MNMSRWTLGLVAIVCGCAGAATSTLVIPRARSQNAERWEYLCLESPDKLAELTSQLNKAGREGWELVGSGTPPGYAGGNFAWCFKRRLP